MMETQIIITKKPRLKKPVLVEGLPGLGLVGKLAADHLVKKLKAKHFADLYSPHFPPQVNIQPDGTIEVPHDEFYYWKNPKKKGSDIIFLVGDYQASSPFGHYEVAGYVMDFAEEMKVKTVYTLGGYGVGYLSKKPKVFAAVTNPALKRKVEKAGARFEKTGGIVGAAGLLIGMAMLRDIDGVCLMGETHGQIIDARAAKAVLDVLNNLLGVKVDTKELEKRANVIEKELEKRQKKVESPEPGDNISPQYIR